MILDQHPFIHHVVVIRGELARSTERTHESRQPNN